MNYYKNKIYYLSIKHRGIKRRFSEKNVYKIHTTWSKCLLEQIKRTGKM